MIAQPFDFEHAVDACKPRHSWAWPRPGDEGPDVSTLRALHRVGRAATPRHGPSPAILRGAGRGSQEAA